MKRKTIMLALLVLLLVTNTALAASWQQIGDFAGAVHPDDNVTALREMMANLQKHAG